MCGGCRSQPSSNSSGRRGPVLLGRKDRPQPIPELPLVWRGWGQLKLVNPFNGVAAYGAVKVPEPPICKDSHIALAYAVFAVGEIAPELFFRSLEDRFPAE